MAPLIPVLVLLALLSPHALAVEALPPPLTGPVNDFAGVIDEASRRQLEAMITALHRATGDVIVVATIDTYRPYGDIREYAVKMFENRGRGIGERGKDNGLLVLLAVDDRAVWIEVGYGLEEFVPDGFAGETARIAMVPYFRRGEFGAGLVAGVNRLATRIAARRGVALDSLPPAPPVSRPRAGLAHPGPAATVLVGFVLMVVLFVVLLALTLSGPPRLQRRRRRWSAAPWSGWESGVGPFGAGRFGGGFGGFGGGFGGFGGGRSGGGGGGASW